MSSLKQAEQLKQLATALEAKVQIDTAKNGRKVAIMAQYTSYEKMRELVNVAIDALPMAALVPLAETIFDNLDAYVKSVKEQLKKDLDT